MLLLGICFDILEIQMSLIYISSQRSNKERYEVSTTQAVCLGQKEQEETFKTVNTTVKSSLKCMDMIHTIMWFVVCIRRL